MTCMVHNFLYMTISKSSSNSQSKSWSLQQSFHNKECLQVVTSGLQHVKNLKPSQMDQQFVNSSFLLVYKKKLLSICK